MNTSTISSKRIHSIYDTHVITQDNHRAHGSLHDYLESHTLDMHDIVLIDEGYFAYDTWSITHQATDPVIPETLYSIVADREERTSNPLRYHRSHISYDGVLIDGTPQTTMLGQTGEIVCRMHTTYCRPSLIKLLEDYGYAVSVDGPTRLPRSYYTIQFAKQMLHKHTCGILTVDELTAKYVTIQDGTISDVQHLNYGGRILKHLLSEQRYKGLYYNMLNDSLSSGAERLCQHVIDEYVSILCDWISTSITPPQTTFVVSSLLASRLFTQRLCDAYKSIGFLLPFYYAETLEDKTKTFDLLHKDLLTAMYFTSHTR